MNNKKMNELQDQLDIAVFEQEEMDVDKVKSILAEMENYTPDEEKKTFDKEQLWKRIEEQSREEFAEEQMIEFDRIKAGKSGEKSKANVGRARRIALTAATIVLAVFVGANIGTYATEKKNVFEYVSDLRNGTSFWITGDAPGMELEEEIEVYYSWNDVPNEYKEFLVIPQGLPEDMELYDIEIRKRETFEGASIRYIDDRAIADFTIIITNNHNKEFTFANSLYEERYVLNRKENINNIDVYFYDETEDEIIVQFIYKDCIYTLGGTIEILSDIVEETVLNLQ